MLAMAGSGPGRILKPMNETTDATAVFAPLWRRKWLILATAIAVAAGSYFYYRREPALYSATTQIYLGAGAEEQAQLGTGTGGSGGKKSALSSTTQTALINSGIIKEAVHARLRRERKTSAVRAALKAKVKAKAAEKSEFITITGESHSARGAALVVNTTAQTYIERKNTQYHAQVEAAIALARKQLRRLEAAQLESLISSGSGSAKKGKASAKGSSAASTLQANALDTKINQLEAELGVSQVSQVAAAKAKQAKLLSPHPKSNAEFGFAIGLLLAAFAAYLLGRMDRRLRSLAAIEQAFHTQVLVALLAVRRPLVYREGHPAPARALREALWRLQTTLQVAGNSTENGRGRGPRTILCVSADAGDGKSTLAAALALAWAEAGERVAVVEADFRRPVQSRLLQLSGSHGLADVLGGMLPVEQALQSVSFVRPEAGVGAAAPLPEGGTATVVDTVGTVSVLVGGTGVANPPALLGRAATGELIRSLADEFDHVLIDAPSPLQFSDAMPLLGGVDGILIVARVGHTRETSARRLMELVQRTHSAPVLGVVANAVSPADMRKYGIPAEVRPRRRGVRHSLVGR